MGILAGVWVIDLVTRGLASGLLIMSNQAVAAGQFWRLLTGSLVSGRIFGVLINMLVLWMAGRALESELGGWRFVTLYLAAGLGGATLLFVLGPFAARRLRRLGSRPRTAGRQRDLQGQVQGGRAR